ALVLVVQDVAVKHPLPREIVEAHDESHGFLPADVDHVLPARKRLRLSIALDDLELKSVHVEGMIHPDQILDLPYLRGTERGREIDAGKIEVPVVDHP